MATTTRPRSARDPDTFEAVLEARLSRRDVLGLAGLVGAGMALAPLLGDGEARADAAGGASDVASGLAFDPVEPSKADAIVVPGPYEHAVLLAWGDPLTRTAPAFDVENQTADAQAQQFGFNSDFVAFLPLPDWVRRTIRRRGRPTAATLRSLGVLYPGVARRDTRRALLFVNHEYPNGRDMFPGYDPAAPTAEQVAVEMAAVGASIVELESDLAGRWQAVVDSPFNRRITAETPMRMTGPAVGHAALRSRSDPEGRHARGTLNNCAGGKTPWGTVLTCEENVDKSFGSFGALSGAARRVHEAMPARRGVSNCGWERHVPRFDLAREPGEYARFGWVVEIDPYDPGSVPTKRTALGRFKHEGAEVVLAPDRRVVVYSGDDEAFQHVFKFVSRRRYVRWDRAANLGLLDEGTLYAARFEADGSGRWLPLVAGAGPLTAERGFATQGDVVLQARRAARLAGATRMDRPEDIAVHPANGRVYLALTRNKARRGAETEGEAKANPRAPNPHGHVLEIREQGGDAAAERFAWDPFLLCGDPGAGHQTYFAGFPKDRVSPIAAPDNLAFDRRGNLWIATDGQPDAPGFGWNDGVFAVPVEGGERGWVRQFLGGARGSEICGPEFSGDGRTFFCAVQHPGEGGGVPNAESRWPDGGVAPRPSVIAVRRRDGGPIGA